MRHWIHTIRKRIDERWLYARKVAFTTMVVYIVWQLMILLQSHITLLLAGIS